MRPIEPINSLYRLITSNNISTPKKKKKFNNYKHSYTLKNREVLGKEGCSF